ncbi:helix-turn-helix domain-containing protein [Streptomyces sp. LN325]|uniref:helix-turn-helix domain-containing protein n=1 Tax=Streptomyces sp. LN325 TaxID=3112976 RepID=UPI0037145F40
MRAQVVPHAARGRSHACVARETGPHLDTVRRRRGRFTQAGLHGLDDRQRRGLPSSFTPPQAAEVEAPACRLSRPRRSSRVPPPAERPEARGGVPGTPQ